MLTSTRLSSLSLGLRAFPLLALFATSMACGVDAGPLPDPNRTSDSEQTPSACATVDCGPGERCELHPVTCVTTPCDPQPFCVAVTVS